MCSLSYPMVSFKSLNALELMRRGSFIFVIIFLTPEVSHFCRLDMIVTNFVSTHWMVMAYTFNFTVLGMVLLCQYFYAECPRVGVMAIVIKSTIIMFVCFLYHFTLLVFFGCILLRRVTYFSISTASLIYSIALSVQNIYSLISHSSFKSPINHIPKGQSISISRFYNYIHLIFFLPKEIVVNLFPT